MTERAWRGALLAGALAAAALGAQAATLTLGLLQRADDERLEPRRVELAYPGHPGGPLQAAVELAASESSFELEAARLQVRFETRSARNAAEARTALQQLVRAGAAAVVLDLPAAWVGPAAAGSSLPLLNAGDADDTLRGAACLPQLLHTLPSERMRADALAQWLVARRWSRMLLLHGPAAEDATRLAAVQASLKRFGLKQVAAKPFKLSADPRERELANVALLTGGAEYDAVWVIDSDGEFARGVPYRTALPRPVVGDAGLVALAWAPGFERFGAPQLARRFARAAQRPMTATDWAGYMAAKAVVQAALSQPTAVGAAGLLKTLKGADFVLDGFKGVRLSFRPWDGQLRQPLLLTDGLGVAGLAPVEGMLHPKNVLDTLGADAPESACPRR
jgi:ABC transporter substrate binding protein (PQQ-dependent alcohol dehydrogenase system)